MSTTIPDTHRVTTDGFLAGSRREEMRRARSAAATAIPRITALLRSVQRPDAHAIGQWDVAETAAHLAHVTAGELFVARTIGWGTGGIPLKDDFIEGVKLLNKRNLAADPERDLNALADRIEAHAAELLDVLSAAEGDEAVGWLAGAVLPASALLCHLLGEFELHGLDITRAEDRPWKMDPEAAALGFGFVLEIIRATPDKLKHSYLRSNARADACFEIRIRGGGRAVMAFERGGVYVEEPSDRKADCCISGDPASLLQLAFRRIGLWPQVLSGRVVAWGPKPWLALQLPHRLRMP